MTPCTVTIGFFVLSRCGHASVAWCPQCRRPVCGGHQGPGGLCPECAAAHGYGSRSPYDARWAHDYRRAYYTRSSQIYADPMWYSSLDSYDRAAFDPGDDYASGGDEYGTGDDPGLVDS